MPDIEWNQLSEYANWVSASREKEDVPLSITKLKVLPDEAVEPPFLLSLSSQTVVGEPRQGGYWFSLNFGGRMNPVDLSNDEKAYIRGMVEFALNGLEDSHESPGLEEASDTIRT